MISKDEAALVSLAIICLVLAACFFITACSDKTSDAYIRDRVVQLRGEHGACTGIQVEAPSGRVYTMTAAHCKAILADDMSVSSTDEAGDTKTIFMVDVDYDSDLMLMTSTSNKSIKVAKKTHRHQKIHTLTHGHMHETYRTDGELLEEDAAKVLVGPVESAEDMLACLAKPSNEVIVTPMGPLCVHNIPEMMTTAIVYPGSSGGPALNDKGELIGIVSVTEGGTIYSGIVPLREILDFIKDR